MQSDIDSHRSRSCRWLARRLDRESRRFGRAVLLAASLFGGGGLARAEPTSATLPSDATLARLIQQSLDARPELARARATVRASEERAPQLRTLPDPMLQVGIQNDGFTSIEIGRMDTSYVSVMASQTFPWPGKLEAQGKLAELSVVDAKNGVVRALLSTEAEIRRGYVDLLLARARLSVLDQLELLWQNASALTRIQYQSGAGSQADVFRTELELSRLKQRRAALAAEEISRVRELNRLRNHPIDEPIVTSGTLEGLSQLDSLRSWFSAERALARSPELSSARLGIVRASKAATVAERNYYPDLTVGAGLMFRGQLPPMWQVTVAGPVPIFSGSRQSRAVAESRAVGAAARSQVEELEQLIRLRSKEREAAFAALLDNVAVYDNGLLLASKATAESTLIQYRAGKVTFASVLEANAGYFADRDSALQAIADAHRLLIAEAEVSLAPAATPGLAGFGGWMPGAGRTAMPGSGRTRDVQSAAPSAPMGSSGGM
jgi:outer membrane protein TolC